jgi:ABC-2 type transport system ATP-binding protein
MIIETKNLTKYYRKRKAIEGLNLKVESNSIYGLLGCNGAGKTTTLSILSGLVKKTKGTVIIGGMDIDKNPDEIKKILGIMPQEMEPYSNKSVMQNILFYASLKGMKNPKEDINQLLDELNIKEIKNIKAKHLSHGQQKLLLIAQAFLNSPKLVILDEPISGFDPKKIVMLRKFLKKRSKQTTIVISSHLLDEIDRLCTHIGIIHNGKLILQGKKEKIKKGKSLEKVFIKNI